MFNFFPPVCTMPLEYCEYSGMTDKCLSWLEANLPDEFEKLNLADRKESTDGEKKHQKRGGKVAFLLYLRNSFRKFSLYLRKKN